MTEPTYWIRQGTRTEGPLRLSEVRLRATRGALTRTHMVSRDRTRWVVASKVRDIFRSDGSVSSDVLALAPPTDDFAMDFSQDDSGELFVVSVSGIANVRAEWILVPAWIVIAVAAVLPTARGSSDALCAWEFVQLNSEFGWRGVLLGALWLVLMLTAATAMGLSTLAKGRTRAVGGLVVGSLATILCTAAVWAGVGSGFIAGMTLLLALFAVRMLDAVLYGPVSSAAGAREPALTLSETAVGCSLAVAVLLVAIVGVVVKGFPFSVAAFFVVVASAACSLAAVHAGGEMPKRTLIVWMSLVTLLAAVLAVLAESITAHILGAPRMAIFESVRAMCVTTLASICAYVSYCELRFIQSPPPPSQLSALDLAAHTSEESAQ